VAAILAARPQVAVLCAFYNVHVLRRLAFLGVITAFVASCLAQQPATKALAIVTAGLPYGFVGERYETKLVSANGPFPIYWVLDNGQLPRGLQLDRDTGVITGVPTEAGTFSFTIGVTDGSNAHARRAYTITVGTRTLNVIWKDFPRVEGRAINGGVEVSNSSDETFDLTVIIVAVDEHDKAFALGYQHFSFPSGAKQQIPFGTTLPRGDYVVHADAVGEVATKNVIRRARIQTSHPLNVTSGP